MEPLTLAPIQPDGIPPGRSVQLPSFAELFGTPGHYQQASRVFNLASLVLLSAIPPFYRLSSGSTPAVVLQPREALLARPTIVAKRWQASEDDALRALVEARGVPTTSREWESIAKRMPFERSIKQCRSRWKDFLAPGIRRNVWTREEDELLLETQARLGNTWSAMLPLFPGRSYPALKNR